MLHPSRDLIVSQKLVVTDEGLLTINHGLDTLTFNRCKVGNRLWFNHFLLGSVHDRLGQWVFRGCFQAGGHPENLILVPNDVRHCWLTDCDGSRLIEDHGLNIVDLFQGLTILDQNPHLGSPASTNHQCGWGCQTKGTWAGDHNNGDRK